LPARIRACAARPGLAKCGGAKQPQRAKPERCFAEPEPPEQGGEQLPIVMRWLPVLYYTHIFIQLLLKLYLS